MRDDSKNGAGSQAAYGPDTIEGRMRLRIRETIEATVEEEREAVLGALAPLLRGGRSRRTRSRG